MKKSILFVSALALTGTLAAASERGGFIGVAPETEVVIGDHPDTYGTASLTAYVMPAHSFSVRSSASTFDTTGGVDRFLTSAGFFAASPMIPNGAQIERVELRACDSDAVAQVTLNMGPCPTAGGTCSLAGTVVTGATPGCNNFSTTLAAPLVVSNANTPILVQVSMGTTTATTFTAVKLFYRLRISPAPATATFTDVPVGHPQRQFVEALAAAGVTGGCGPGIYCPDSAVTRGQMAVFLSVALGLHFPN